MITFASHDNISSKWKHLVPVKVLQCVNRNMYRSASSTACLRNSVRPPLHLVGGNLVGEENVFDHYSWLMGTKQYKNIWPPHKQPKWSLDEFFSLKQERTFFLIILLSRLSLTSWYCSFIRSSLITVIFPLLNDKSLSSIVLRYPLIYLNLYDLSVLQYHWYIFTIQWRTLYS